MSKTQIVYRRADNGQFTSKKYAENHPNTTVKENNVIKNDPKKPKPSSK